MLFWIGIAFAIALVLTAAFGGPIDTYLAACIAARHKRNCVHPRATERRWLDPDGTPMIDWRCPDCGEHDRGHVYADPKTWVENNG
jgi:hypothetical protein